MREAGTTGRFTLRRGQREMGFSPKTGRGKPGSVAVRAVRPAKEVFVVVGSREINLWIHNPIILGGVHFVGGGVLVSCARVYRWNYVANRRRERGTSFIELLTDRH